MPVVSNRTSLDFIAMLACRILANQTTGGEQLLYQCMAGLGAILVLISLVIDVAKHYESKAQEPTP